MSKISFLPTGYQAPKASGGYMKLQDGENRIRIITQPIIGWEDWTLDKKPVRFKMDNKPLKAIDPKQTVRHFWSFVVWNYAEEQIQILHLTQATIRNSIEALCNDDDWGQPFFYDLKIIKKGEGKDTEYMINPMPHKEVSAIIKQAYAEKPCYLEALFDNQDPFAREWETFTAPIFTHDDVFNQIEDKPVKSTATLITKDQSKILKDALLRCSISYQEQIHDILKKPPFSIFDIDMLPVNAYESLLQAAIKNKIEE